MRRYGWGRVLQVLLLVGGLTLLGVIVYRVGPAKLWQQITAFGIGLVIFVALEFVRDAGRRS
jgi:hypothetical protein